MQNFTEIIPEKPLRRGLNASGVAKYRVVGHVEDYISGVFIPVSIGGKIIKMTKKCESYSLK